jgi:uncharacterized protein YjbI with pentapeptide repeats
MKSSRDADPLALGVLYALLIALPTLAAPRRSVVVLDVTIADVSAIPDVEAVRASVSRTGKTPRGWLASDLEGQGYALIDQEAIDRGLNAIGATPATCGDAVCAARLGKTLGADRVVLAKVTKVSSIVWILDATLVDASANRAVHREELELKGDIAQLLPHALRSTARRLAAADPDVRAAAAPSAIPGERPKPTRDQVLALLAAASEGAPVDLSGLDLSGLDLEGTDFRRADLSRSRLVGARLRGARMFGVKMTDAVATGAVLAGAVLDFAVLERTDLTGADLRDASLYATILTRAVLTQADLTRARVISSMAGAKLMRAKLASADLGADPGNQPMGLMRTDLSGADLTGADLTSANLRKVNFTQANLSGADLTEADVAGAEFMGAIVRGIRGRARLRSADRAKNLDLTTSGE